MVGGNSYTLPTQTKSHDYRHALSEEEWLSWHKQSQSHCVLCARINYHTCNLVKWCFPNDDWPPFKPKCRNSLNR